MTNTRIIPLPVRRRLTTLLVALFGVAIVAGNLLQTQVSADIPPLNPAEAVESLTKGGNNPTSYPTLLPVVTDVSGYLVKFVGVAAIFAFLAGAYSYFLSAGNDEQLQKGRNQMVGSMVALFLVISATAIVDIFVNFFRTGSL